MARPMIAVLALLLGCKPQPGIPFEAYVAPPRETEPPAPTGVVDAGRYRDQSHAFEISVPEGWQANVGQANAALRVSLQHGSTRAKVEVWAFSGIDLTPRARADCDWTFSDVGHYGPLGAEHVLVAATCIPKDPSNPRVFAYILGRTGWTWQLEAHVPGTALVEGQRAADKVLETANWPVRSTAGVRSR